MTELRVCSLPRRSAASAWKHAENMINRLVEAATLDAQSLKSALERCRPLAHYLLTMQEAERVEVDLGGAKILLTFVYTPDGEDAEPVSITPPTELASPRVTFFVKKPFTDPYFEGLMHGDVRVFHCETVQAEGGDRGDCS